MTRNAQTTKTESELGRTIRRLAVSPWIVIDAVLWAVMFALAIWLRFDFSLGRLAESLGAVHFYWVLAGLIGLTALLGWVSGLYRGRYIPGSLLEASVLTYTFGIITVLVFLAHLAGGPNQLIPRSTPVIAGAFTVLGALITRSMARRKELFGAGGSDDAEPAIIFGAGDGGLQLVRQLRRSETTQFRPVALLDDDPAKRNMVIEGVRVYGGRDRLDYVVEKTRASTLIVAVPSLSGDQLIQIRDDAESAGLHVLVLPPLDTMFRGRVAATELREINVNDLLGRQPATLNQTEIASYLRGKRVLVTGAGGSIGSELCRQLTRFRPAELMMLDRDESGLHAVQLSINSQAMLDGDDTILASIRDREAMMRIFEKRRPEIVFHAAALKHMPLLEQYPVEALKTNVIGTLNVLEAAEASGVDAFVNISTDKAANPSSALGTSKRIAERLTAGKAQNNSATKFVSVRFGNVLGSRGSVLTVFEKQIREGGPVTVTDPNVDRFFMTIPEACQLVLQAATIGETGDTLVLNMGDPIRIADVAKTLIEQSGREIEIVYTGLRDGEKLSEVLFDSTENPRTSGKHESISEVKVRPIDLDYTTLIKMADANEVKSWLNQNV